MKGTYFALLIFKGSNVCEPAMSFLYLLVKMLALMNNTQQHKQKSGYLKDPCCYANASLASDARFYDSKQIHKTRYLPLFLCLFEAFFTSNL